MHRGRLSVKENLHRAGRYSRSLGQVFGPADVAANGGSRYN